MKAQGSEPKLPEVTANALKLLVVVGGLTFFAGLWLAPHRIWPDFLMVSYFLIEMSLAGIFFVALHYVSGASWPVAIRRIPETMALLLPLGALGLGILLIFHPSIHPWAATTSGGEFAIPLTGFKQLWLNRGFFTVRSVIYILSWLTFAFTIVRNSRHQDVDGNLSWTFRNVRLSAGFLVVFGITLFLASFDWIMSLDPRWYSTIFGIYDFASMFLGGLAALIILAVWLHHLAPEQFVLTEAHLHDLGKLLFAFSTFWAYIWFSQYMLIWYANIPEETIYFVKRLHGEWGFLFVLDLLLNWGLPFFVLLPQKAKKSPNVLVRISLIVLLGRWLDLYLMIMPAFAGQSPLFGVWEVTLPLGAMALFVLLFFHTLRGAHLMPVNDPRLIESLQEAGH